MSMPAVYTLKEVHWMDSVVSGFFSVLFDFVMSFVTAID